MEKKKKIWITAMAVVIGAAGYGVYKIQDNRKREAAYQSAKDSLVLKLEENPAIECGTEIDDMNALALSYVKESHGDLSVKGTEGIDPEKIGDGELTYTVSTKDSYGVEVSKEETLKVKVVDTQAPEITLVKDTVELMVGDEFDPFTNIKSVKDKADGEIDKASLTVDNPVDKTKPGEYTVTVTAKDSADNTETKTYSVAVASKQTTIMAKTGTARQSVSKNTTAGVAGRDNGSMENSGNPGGDIWDLDTGVLFDNGGKVDPSITANGNALYGDDWIAMVYPDGSAEYGD